MSTERLYYRDSHLTEFDARVIEHAADARGRAGVRLDRTAFYPEGGGQPSDTGVIEDARVVECIDEEEAGVLHVLEGTAPAVGARVRCRVDRARRLDHLQQHTGQHILSQALVKLFGAPTRSFRMMERVSEIDVELAEPSWERIEQAVDLANRIVWEDRPLKVHQVAAEEAARMPLRKDSARAGSLRVVEIEGFDLSPCGGTHAHRTGEVGLVAVSSWERAKGMTRVEFAAGRRALADYRLANRAARDVAALFSAGRDDAAAAVARALEESKALARRVRALEESAARAEADQLANDATALGGGATKLVARTFDGRDAEALKRLASALVARPGLIALLGSRDGDAARLVFARSADARGDMNALMREACLLVEGRGGGRSDLAQGGGRNAAGVEEAVEAAARKLRALL